MDSAIQNCRTCDNAESAPVSGWWNWQDCDFLIISTNAYVDEHYAKTLGTLLKAAGFSSAFCGVTHVTKCGFPVIDKVNIDNCARYVYDQIDLARPKAIGILGATPFDLFRTNQKNYSSSIGSSWWWGVYKMFALPSSKSFEEEQWLPILTEAHDYIYGPTMSMLDIP